MSCLQKPKTMDNVQNNNVYENIPLSKTFILKYGSPPTSHPLAEKQEIYQKYRKLKTSTKIRNFSEIMLLTNTNLRIPSTE
jgi:hypothetical protein